MTIPDAQKYLRQIAKELPVVLQGFVGAEMGSRTLSASFKTGGAAFDASTAKNTTAQLRVASGRLIKSFNPASPENVAEIQVDGESLSLKYGSKVPYAAIHEYGGTISHPGSSKRQAFVVDGRLVVTNFTKPHSIPIPKRPYLEPALRKFEAEGLPVFTEKLLNLLVADFNRQNQ